MKINVNDTDKIKDALAEVNGRASAHTLASWQVIKAATCAELALEDRGVPKAQRAGAVLDYYPEGPGKAYARKSRHFITTRITLTRGASDWFLTNCRRFDGYSDSPEHFVIQVTPAVADTIRACAMQGIVVK